MQIRPVPMLIKIMAGSNLIKTVLWTRSKPIRSTMGMCVGPEMRKHAWKIWLMMKEIGRGITLAIVKAISLQCNQIAHWTAEMY